MKTQIDRINKVAKMVGTRTGQEDKLEPDWGSEESINGLKKDWEKIAEEPLEVEYVKGTYYGMGSEIACLRLFYKYNQAVRTESTRFNYSENLGSFYFSLDV